MAKKYTIPSSGAIAGLISALQDFYSTGVTIHGSDTNGVVFSIPAISSKVFKIITAGSMYTGDAWSSGITITNSQTIAIHFNSWINREWILACSTNGFIATCTITKPFHIGAFKLSNGDSVAFGLAWDTTNNAYYDGSRMLLLSNNSEIQFFKLNSTSCLYPNGDLITFPIYLMDSASKLILNQDGSFTRLLDMVQTCTRESIYTASNYIIFGGDKIMKGAGAYGFIPNGFVLPID